MIAEFWQRESRPPRLMWMPPRRGSFTAILTIDCDPVPVATRLGLMPAHDVFDPVGSGYHSIPAARANLVLRTSSALPSSQAPAFAIGGLGQLADAVFECSGLPGKEAR
ncbi:MAG: hypothetical protein EOO27_14975 [Comamonadaceae bacterium]|nr:MAG: hypothetical protein EOO27_14975 [Comamonadaceae bacterium]